MSDTVLTIYRAASGQWSGRIVVAGEELARVAGCSSLEEVEEDAYAQFEIDRVEVE